LKFILNGKISLIHQLQIFHFNTFFAIGCSVPDIRVKLRNLKKLFDDSKGHLKQIEDLRTSLEEAAPSMSCIIHNMYQEIGTTLQSVGWIPCSATIQLNELFAIEPDLMLTEDHTNTIVLPSAPSILFKNLEFSVLATCLERDVRKFSEAMLSKMR
jgi:hypothetical protein